MQLLEHEWMSINQMVYKIWKADDEKDMRTAYVNNINILIPCDRASFYVADFCGGKILTDGVGLNFTRQRLACYPNEYMDDDYGKWLFISSESKAYRTSDWLPEEQRVKHPYYLEAFSDLNIHYEVRLPLFYDQTLMGFTALFRSKDHHDFSDRDMFILEVLKNHLALYLYKNLFLKKADFKQTTDIEGFSKKYGLTPREQEILKLLLVWENNEEIANKLCISQNTQKKHVMNIYKKLNIGSRNDLLKMLWK